MRITTSSRTFVLGVVLVGLPLSSQAAKAEPLVEKEDRETAKKASLKASEFCKDLEKLDTPASRKSDLQAASGDNWVLQQMKGAKDNKELTENMQNNIDAGFMVAKGGPIVASILFMLAYCMCCWTACPFCKCCRVCRKARKVNTLFKLIGFGVLGGICFGIVISAGMSRGGFQAAVSGFDHTSCTGSKLLNSTLGGNANPYFRGILPTLDSFDALLNSLAPNSAFLTALDAKITDTKKIEQAVALASGTMGLLKDMMASSANKQPKSTTNVNLQHECTLCPKLVDALTPAIKTLNDGIASKLNNARDEVRKQLTGPALGDLAKTTRDGTAPLVELKKLFIKMFGFIVNTDDLQNLSDMLHNFGLYFCLILVLVALLISCCACSGMGLWTFREIKTLKGVGEIVVGSAGDEIKEFSTKHRSHVHRCSLCTWCTGCYFVFFALLVGGIMTALSVPLASICLILDDVDSKLLTDIGGVLPVNFTGDSGDILKNTIDQCFRNKDKNANPYLLDIIYTRDPTTDAKITLRKTIVEDTKDMINKQFSEITKSMSPGAMSLNTDANIVSLKSTLQNTRMDGMMLPPSTIGSGSFQNMGLDARSSNQLSLYWGSSAACADFVVPAGMGALSGKTVKGISSFQSSLTFFGSTVVHSSCAKQVACSAAPGTNAGKACAAANLFMNLKRELQTTKIFKCRKFKKNNGAPCDIVNMQESPIGSGTYINDCMKADGTWEALEYACDLAEFTAMTQSFSQRLDKVFARLDKSAGLTMTDINVNMRGLVDKHIIKRIETIADGLTCGFLGKHYQAFVDGTCYAGVWGFTQISNSYVACGALTLFLSIMMYIVWRISVDNFNSSQSQVEPQ